MRYRWHVIGIIAISISLIQLFPTYANNQSLPHFSEVGIIGPFESKLRFDVEEVNGTFYLLLCFDKAEKVEVHASTDSENWTYIGDACSRPNSISAFRRPEALYANGTFHLWVDGVLKDEDVRCRDTLYYHSSKGFLNMSFGGVAIKHGVTRLLDRGAIVTDVWFNETDGKYHAFVGGGQLSSGRWHFVYHAASKSPARFKLDSEPLMSTGSFSLGSWGCAHIYPPQGEWINGSYYGIGVGCNLLCKPYNHTADLVILREPSDLSLENYVSGDGETTFFAPWGNVQDATLIETRTGIYVFLARYSKDILILRMEL